MKENLLSNQELGQAALELQKFIEEKYNKRIHFLGVFVNAESTAAIRMGRPKPLAWGWASVVSGHEDIANRLVEILPD